MFQEEMKKLRMVTLSNSISKDILVSGLKLLKHTVAITVDETSDLRILHKAHVVLGLGSGSEVAYQNAHIILR
jgi:cation transport ATPase